MSTTIRRIELVHLGQDRLHHPMQDRAALATVTGTTVPGPRRALEPESSLSLSRTAACRLCHTERPLAELTFAEDAAEQPFGPVCSPMAPGKLDCLHVRELRDRWETAARLETKLTLERDEVQALWPVLKAGGL